MNNENKSNINWYPGHMAKAIKEIAEKLKLVDLVVVLLDARCPKASFNPLLKELLQQKRCLYLLTKKDKADNQQTIKWLKYYNQNQIRALAIDARELKNTKLIVKEATILMAEKRKKDLMRGLKPRPIKTMIVGTPNVGKSTLINALVGKKVTAVGDHPGITKVQQWIKINHDLELLDTPGVLWPKFDEEVVGYNLSIIGAINDNILPMQDIATYFVDYLQKYYPNALKMRYHLDLDHFSAIEIISALAQKQGYYLSNKELDLTRASLFLIQEYRMGYLGSLTLEQCEINE